MPLPTVETVNVEAAALSGTDVVAGASRPTATRPASDGAGAASVTTTSPEETAVAAAGVRDPAVPALSSRTTREPQAPPSATARAATANARLITDKSDDSRETLSAGLSSGRR